MPRPPFPNLKTRVATILGTGLLLVALLAGCPAFFAADDPALLRVETSGLRFPHRFHVEEQGLACEDCHEQAGVRPSEETCAICHDPVGPQGAAVPECRTCHTRDDLAVASTRPPEYADVIFEHAPHEAAGVTCDRCHGDMAASDGGPYPRPSMIACASCHEERRAPTTCETCHRDERGDRPPPSHAGAGWIVRHGTEARTALDRPQEYDATCFYCHLDLDCEACHDAQAPRDHTESWRVAGHGLAAEMDRTRCMTCHVIETCERCHRLEPPRTHRGSWGAPTDRHCVQCHLPVGDTPCLFCHEDTPSHDLATPQPIWHSPGMNCKQCHGPGLAEPLPHLDSGDDCNDCHL